MYTRPSQFVATFLFILSLFFPLTCTAQSANNSIPPELQQWIPWVLYDQEEKTCSLETGNSNRRYCTWPSQLNLDVRQDGASFTQTWIIETRSLVALPGNRPYWPSNVTSNGKNLLVTKHRSSPAVWLDPGEHTITGTFSWKKLPEQLRVPPATGLVRLTLDGKVINNLHLDQQGIWFKHKKTTQKSDGDSLHMQVFRKIQDGVPLLQHILIHLTVSGSPRQITLGLEHDDAFAPLKLHSALPVRFDKAGKIQLQARPGQWTIQLTLRNTLPLSPEILGMGANKSPWPEEEIWVFAADPKLRQVEIKDVPPVDPSRTALPEDWKTLSAYLITEDSKMMFIEKNRGNPHPLPNRLNLKRKIWLDEQGTGLTVYDILTGTMTHGWRLDVDPSQPLGKVDIDGKSILITKLKTSEKTGVEVRQGRLELHAESRINKIVQTGQLKIPALGWDHDFQRLSAELNLPPGWKLLTASGVDSVSTWFNQWTLLDIFLVLIIGLATARILGPAWGAVAIILLIFAYHQPGSPRYLWLPLLGLLAIQQIITSNIGEKLCRIGGFILLITIIVGSIPYMINEIRVGIYPQLQYGKHYRIMKERNMMMDTAASEISTDAREDLAEKTQYKKALSKATPANRKNTYSLTSMASAPYTVKNIQVDPQEMIQTGPGLPEWKWNTIQLRWNGPVSPEQNISFVFLSPLVNTVLAFVRVFLLILLISGFLRKYLIPRQNPSRSTQSTTTALLFCTLLPLLFTPQNVQATIPTPEILHELQTRLLSPPECKQQCATITVCSFQIEDDVLSVELQIDTLYRSAVPLPGQNRFFDTIQLNQKAPQALRLTPKGYPIIRLETGRHTVHLKKNISGHDTISFTFPLLPENGRALLNGWTINGLHGDGRLDQQVSLSKIQTSKVKQEGDSTFQIPAFVRVERTFHMGLKWTVSTRVIRQTPGTVIGLTLPLMPGEHVTTASLQVTDQHVRINMGSNQNSLTYLSSITPVDSLLLSAKKTSAWTETWFLDVSPIWHLETRGLPEINQTTLNGKRFPEYQPYPGESLQLYISRPHGVPGAVMTINRSKLIITPGIRSTATKLRFSLTASRELQHSITLPSDIDLQKTLINGREFPLQLEDNQLVIPIEPGKTEIEISWRSKRGVDTKLITESVDIGVENVNASIELVVPSSRWILLTGGPQIGPAVLFWGELLVIVLLALLLGRIKFTPLSTLQWLLLSLGLSQIPAPFAAIVVAWLILLGLRKKRINEISGTIIFNSIQIVLILLTFAALAALFFAIQKGLLGHPDMQIGGNDSSGRILRWYQDRSDATLPTAWIITVPLLVYRISMLLWALWLAIALLKWLRWGWECFSEGSIWKKSAPRKKPIFRKRKTTSTDKTS